MGLVDPVGAVGFFVSSDTPLMGAVYVSSLTSLTDARWHFRDSPLLPRRCGNAAGFLLLVIYLRPTLGGINYSLPAAQIGRPKDGPRVNNLAIAAGSLIAPCRI